MIIILSQKIDTESAYTGDEVFRTYHYPGRYRNQIHTGDVFVYYQGNRYDKSQRYYFGTGWIGNIKTEDEDNYYAELLNVVRFEKKGPIYLPDGGGMWNNWAMIPLEKVSIHLGSLRSGLYRNRLIPIFYNIPEIAK